MRKIVFILVLFLLLFQSLFLIPAQAEDSIFDEGYIPYVIEKMHSDPNFVNTAEFRNVLDELHAVNQARAIQIVLQDCNQVVSEMKADLGLPLPAVELAEHEKLNDFLKSRE